MSDETNKLGVSSTMDITDSNANTGGLFFGRASPADIVRANQKDQFYLKQLADQSFDVISRIFGARNALKYQREVTLISELIYYCLSTVIGNQTLGEEYCDIIQVRRNRAPRAKTRFALVLLHVGLPYTLTRLYEHITSINQSRKKSRLNKLIPAWIKPFFVNYNSQIKETITTIQKIHLAIFYFSGTFYEFSKRLLDINYIFNRNPDSRGIKYHLLGVLILIQLTITSILMLSNVISKNREKKVEGSESVNSEEAESEISNTTCTLCLENRKNTTATPCGHLFCWNCITEWTNNKPECPLCRQAIQPNKLVCIYHYQ